MLQMSSACFILKVLERILELSWTEMQFSPFYFAALFLFVYFKVHINFFSHSYQFTNHHVHLEDIFQITPKYWFHFLHYAWIQNSASIQYFETHLTFLHVRLCSFQVTFWLYVFFLLIVSDVQNAFLSDSQRSLSLVFQFNRLNKETYINTKLNNYNRR